MKRTQATPFEDETYGCNQGGANLCGADARPTDELSLASSGEGEQRVCVCSGVLKEKTSKAIFESLPRGGWIQGPKAIAPVGLTTRH